MSQAVTKSTAPPTHAEWTATITGLGHWARREEERKGEKGEKGEKAEAGDYLQQPV